jgi:hypothetical protein
MAVIRTNCDFTLVIVGPPSSHLGRIETGDGEPREDPT